jgi:hypothetical protein
MGWDAIFPGFGVAASAIWQLFLVIFVRPRFRVEPQVTRTALPGIEATFGVCKKWHTWLSHTQSNS